MKKSKYIDHTLLKPTATAADIEKLCMEAKEYDFYSVCVNPYYVKLASSLLEGTDIKVACVIGFPLGANSTEIKKLEAQEAVANGATELDMVINQGLFKMGEYAAVLNDINAVCQAGVPVKVIVETSNLNSEEIAKLCDIVNESNALFIKTSTGFVGEGARLDDVKLMASLMKPGKFVKASGGIRDAETFENMIEAGATRIGTSSGTKLV
ncbi:MAG: deoxyribose-phosphate aldolase [Clostridia bacterium]|nr:deoxyribose-phosphate aldolase [Clostridia bacterium]